MAASEFDTTYEDQRKQYHADAMAGRVEDHRYYCYGCGDPATIRRPLVKGTRLTFTQGYRDIMIHKRCASR